VVFSSNNSADELTKASSAERLRMPEFSQPLATALQLALLAVLESWVVSPMAVVGHSSGEIAAACAAGLLTPEEAIKIAFFRGQACVPDSARPALGMLAVGLGPDQVQAYIRDIATSVQIGCFNSPSSVTLSGDRTALEKIKGQIQSDGHFARMLQVDFAYHSMFMAQSAVSYEDMILRNCGPPLPGKEDVAMFSSVTGKRLGQPCDSIYWTTNMTSPVRFDEAVREMVSGPDGANFLIEIGPSGALAGPIKQIQKALGDHGSNIQYCAALSRGKDSIKSLFDVAGRLSISGDSAVNLSKVNEAQGPDKALPSVIVDLPNYVWNHSTKYWYENDASKDWRFRKFPHHDLLGSKILGTSWNAPSWKKTLRVENLHWLKDHRVSVAT
jgi:acyl transferase domain-containing protein